MDSEQSAGHQTTWVLHTLVVAALLIFVVTLRFTWVYTVDDAFITLRYSENFGRGNGLVYNLGERVEGYTNFLWTVWLAIPYALGWASGTSGEVFTKLSGAGLVLIAAASAGAVATRMTGSKPVGYLTGAALLACPSIAITVNEGLETALLIALLSGTLLLFMREEEARVPWSALPATALALTRPDAAGFTLLFLTAAVLCRRNWVYCIRYGYIVIIIGGTYMAWRMSYYGWLFPNTFYAKKTGAGSAEYSILAQGRLWEFLTAYGLLLLSPLLLGNILPHVARAYALLILAAILIRIQFHLWSGGATMGHLRFLLPVLPLVLILVANGACQICHRLSGVYRMKQWNLVPGAVAVVFGYSLLSAWLFSPRWFGEYVTYGTNLRRAHFLLGDDIRRTFTDSAVMMMDDAGAAPLRAGITNVDDLGLCDGHISHQPGKFMEKTDQYYLQERNPSVIVMLSNIPRPRGVQDVKLVPSKEMWQSKWFQQRFTFWKTYKWREKYYLAAYRRQES